MGNLRPLVCAVALAWAWGCAGPWAAIDRLEDRRAFDQAALDSFLRDPKPEVRARALLALGRLQDARGVPLVVEALKDPVAEVRARAAFAAGQLGLSWQPLEPSQRDALAQAMLAALEPEPDAAVRARLLRALGDVAGQRALTALVARGREAGAALALGVAVRRGAAPPPGTLELFAKLTSAAEPDGAREAGAYGLAVLKAQPAVAVLTGLLGDRSALVRALAAKGLGALLADAEAQVLAGALDDADWRVAAEASRALAKISGRCAAPLCRADALLAQGLVPQVTRLHAAAHGDRSSDASESGRGAHAAGATPWPGGVAAPAQRAVVAASNGRAPQPSDPGGVDAHTQREALAAQRAAGPGAAAVGGAHGDSEAAAGTAWSGRDPAAQVLLALAQEGLPAHGAPVLAALRAALAPRLREGSMFANLDCRLAAAQVALVESLAPVRSCGGGQLAEGLALAWGLRAMAHAPPTARDAAVAEVAPFLAARDGRLVPAALEALAALGGDGARAAVRPLLDSKDPIVAAAAAAAAVALVDRQALPAVERLVAQGLGNLDVAAGLADTAAGLKAWDGDAPAPGPVARQAARWLTPWLSAQHAVVRHAAAQAITQLTGVPTRVEEQPLTTAAAPPRALREGATLVLTTEAGRIRLALEGQQAPRTAAWFADLARRGYFDGLTFHRVVPDFVVQGGDPRGDGEGGPGASLRCEINEERYGTGALGVALSGKDTGGSQFFITHAPQPHLDGRYTVFGHLVEGQAVADGLLEGDLLLRAQVEGD